MATSKKVAVVLSGCGFQDGSEINESVLTLLALDLNDAEYHCFAPDIIQTKVQDHYKQQEMDEQRNVLVESARIARGEIKPLTEFQASEFDAIILPGGFGAALNLSDFAINGPDCVINADVEQAIRSMHSQHKVIGALCIAPVLLAKLLPNAELTIGQDEGVANAVVTMGASHHKTNHAEIVIDEKNNLVTTPCYMLDASISDIYAGATKLVSAVLERV